MFSTPPNTRQAMRRKNERVSSPPPLPPSANNGTDEDKFTQFPSIPNLPSGLTIERVSPTNSASPDGKICISCRHPGEIALI